MEDAEKLQILLDYYVKLIKIHKLSRKSADTRFFGKDSILDNLFKKVVKLYGYDSKPKAMDKKDFENLNTTEFYHGFEEYEFGRNFLQDQDYHTGTGDETVGFYSTKSFDEALCYTSGSKHVYYDAGRILKFKMSEDRKVILSEQLYKYHSIIECNIYSDIYNFLIRQLPNSHAEKINTIIKFIKSIENENLRRGFLSDISESAIIATILGYDAIILCSYGVEKYFVVLNRGAMCVSDSSIKNFEDAAKIETKQPE